MVTSDELDRRTEQILATAASANHQHAVREPLLSRRPNRLPLRRTMTSCSNAQSAFVQPVLVEATSSCLGRRLCSPPREPGGPGRACSSRPHVLQ
ncbi:hypothetical protein [Rhodococcus opacus]|uniref:hypothetical protein n=1 Tax=Rhodococcus opacus TaxID=37919 RepID=UPI00352C2FD8